MSNWAIEFDIFGRPSNIEVPKVDKAANELPDDVLDWVENQQDEFWYTRDHQYEQFRSRRRLIRKIRKRQQLPQEESTNTLPRVSSITNQNLSEYSTSSFRQHQGTSQQNVVSLQHAAALAGHNGCVNRLEWNNAGDLLASEERLLRMNRSIGAFIVSDDRKLCIWSLQQALQKHSDPSIVIATGHEANISGCCFVDGTKVATGAYDGKVELHDICTSLTLRSFNCHTADVKQVVSLPSSYVFWSCSDDGSIRQFDSRVKHVCQEEGCCKTNILVGSQMDPSMTSSYHGSPNAIHRIPDHLYWKRMMKGPLIGNVGAAPPFNFGKSDVQSTFLNGLLKWKSISMNPIRDEYLLTGAKMHGLLRVYDRRMLSIGNFFSSMNTLPCETFLPFHLSEARDISSGYIYPTRVGWSPDGKEIIASYSGSDVFVFPFLACRTDDTAALHIPIRQLGDRLAPPFLNNDVCSSSNSYQPRANFSTWNVESPTKHALSFPSKEEASTSTSHVEGPQHVTDSSPLSSELVSKIEGIQCPLNNACTRKSFNEDKQQQNDDVRRSDEGLSKGPTSSSPYLPKKYPPYVRLLPPGISDAFYTIVEERTDQTDSIGQGFYHRFQEQIRKLQIKGNAFVKANQASDAIVAYTAALKLCGPPFPAVRIWRKNDSMKPRNLRAAIDQSIDGNEAALVLDERQTALRIPLLCNRARALISRNAPGDSTQSWTDALEALAYDPSNKKAAFRLLQACRFQTQDRTAGPARIYGSFFSVRMFVYEQLKILFTDSPKAISHLVEKCTYLPGFRTDSNRHYLFSEDPLLGYRTSCFSTLSQIRLGYQLSIPWGPLCMKNDTESDLERRKRQFLHAELPPAHPHAIASNLLELLTSSVTSVAAMQSTLTLDQQNKTLESTESQPREADASSSSTFYEWRADKYAQAIKEEGAKATEQRRRVQSHAKGRPQEDCSKEIHPDNNEDIAMDMQDLHQLIDSPLQHDDDDIKMSCNDEELPINWWQGLFEELVMLQKYMTYRELALWDYWQPRMTCERFRGRSNNLTDIQEAVFWGTRIIVSGADTNHIVFWRRSDGAIIKVIESSGSDGINCVRPHPDKPFLATSGLSDLIQLWEPKQWKGD